MTTEVASTKDQVAALMDAGNDSAADIAEQIGVTKASVYGHMRNIRQERGEKPRGRGRPPKAQSAQTTTTRKAPPKSTSTPAKRGPGRPPKSTTEKAQPAARPAPATAKQNGHGSVGDRFPNIKKAIEAELAEARKSVTALEKMLAAAS